jgi:hypothetical protein
MIGSVSGVRTKRIKIVDHRAERNLKILEEKYTMAIQMNDLQRAERLRLQIEALKAQVARS